MLWNLGIYKVFGATAAVFHVANLLLYGLIVVLVWLLVRRVAGTPQAWIATALFAVYPRHGESVAWISGSTDLTAVALALGALFCAIADWRVWRRAVATAALTAAATLAKEVAFVLPALAVLLLLRRSEGGQRRWAIPAAMALAEVGTFAARYAVIGGFGGYSGYPWTPFRAVRVAASYAVASLTPPGVEAFHHKVVLVLPVVLVLLGVWRAWILWRRDDRDWVYLALLGVAWFLLSLVPFLNLAVDLNNANGERLMFLGTVGLALLVAGLVGPQPARVGFAAAGVATAAMLVLSVYDATDWIHATRLSDRLIRTAPALAAGRGELVLLDAPENYRTAHVFTGGNMDPALRYRGIRGLRTVICTQVTVRKERPGVVWFRPVGTAYEGTTTWAAPFDFPAFRSAIALTGECSYSRAPGSSGPIGLGLAALAVPKPVMKPFALAVFDGRDLRPMPH